MPSRARLSLCAVLCSASLSLCAQTPANPRLEALKQYVLVKEYPEVFGDAHYKTRIEGVVDADIDNDGQVEIVVLYFPHYRQSAPIVIYKLTPSLEVSRVIEGLAPGPLQSLSGDYLDAHTLGSAADFELPRGKAGIEEVLKIATGNGFGSLVAYDGFYHMDSRKGFGSFVDLRGVPLPGPRHDCGEFEFSHVRQIAAGHLREDATSQYLAAWVGEEIYVYQIRGVTSAGLLNKQRWRVKAPAGFKGFVDGLAYETAAGKQLLTLQ